MEELLNKYCGKLYDRDSIEKWDLPEGIKERMEFNENDFFFVTTSKESQHGQKHVHITIYPTKHEIVNLLEVEVPEIVPQVLSRTLEILKENGCDIIDSTGFCSSDKLCHFGVFFSIANQPDNDNLISNVKKLKNVQNVRIFNYTCEGCSEY